MHTSARQIYIRVHTGQGAVGNHGLPASPTGTVLTTGTLACRRHSNLRRRIERLGLWARAQPAMRLGSPTVTALCSDAGAAGFRVRPGSRSPVVGMARVPGPWVPGPWFQVHVTVTVNSQRPSTWRRLLALAQLQADPTWASSSALLSSSCANSSYTKSESCT